MRQIVALPAASIVFRPIRLVSVSYWGLSVTLANGRTATVGTPERAAGAGAGADDATLAAGLPAVRYHAAPAMTMSAASAAPTGANQPRTAGFGFDATGGLPTSST